MHTMSANAESEDHECDKQRGGQNYDSNSKHQTMYAKN